MLRFVGAALAAASLAACAHSSAPSSAPGSRRLIEVQAEKNDAEVVEAETASTEGTGTGVQSSNADDESRVSPADAADVVVATAVRLLRRAGDATVCVAWRESSDGKAREDGNGLARQSLPIALEVSDEMRRRIAEGAGLDEAGVCTEDTCDKHGKRPTFLDAGVLFVTVSRVHVHGDRASAEGSAYCGPLCGWGARFVLRRVEGAWRVVAEENGWLS